jgi:hypothetical protein
VGLGRDKIQHHAARDLTVLEPIENRVDRRQRLKLDIGFDPPLRSAVSPVVIAALMSLNGNPSSAFISRSRLLSSLAAATGLNFQVSPSGKAGVWQTILRCRYTDSALSQKLLTPLFQSGLVMCFARLFRISILRDGSS